MLQQGEEVVPETPAEVLYRAMLPNLPQYMVSACVVFSSIIVLILDIYIHFNCTVLYCVVQIALLKILLAAAPTSKTKSDSINILADILPEEMP